MDVRCQFYILFVSSINPDDFYICLPLFVVALHVNLTSGSHNADVGIQVLLGCAKLNYKRRNTWL